MKKIILLVIACFCLSTIHAQNIGFDSLFLHERNPFYDNDNELRIYTLKNPQNFIDLLQSTYGKEKKETEYISQIRNWKHLNIGTLSDLNLEVRTSQEVTHEDIKCNLIRIEVLDSKNNTLLGTYSNTLPLLLKHFKTLLDSTLFNQKDSLVFQKKTAPDTLNLVDTIPSENYQLIELQLLDTLNLYALRDTFEISSLENYHLKMGNLFCKDKKHAILTYPISENLLGDDEGYYQSNQQFVLYEYENKQWVKKQSFVLEKTWGKLSLNDCNFDGYKDVEVYNGSEGGIVCGQVYHSYYLLLYDSIRHLLKKVPNVESIEMDSESKFILHKDLHLIEFPTHGCGHNREFYQWNKDNLELIKGVYIEDVEVKNTYVYREFEVKNRIMTCTQEKNMSAKKAWKKYEEILKK